MSGPDHRQALRALCEELETVRYTSALLGFFALISERLPANRHVHEYKAGRRSICWLTYWLGDIHGSEEERIEGHWLRQPPGVGLERQ